jgi:hypothetical protein
MRRNTHEEDGAQERGDADEEGLLLQSIRLDVRVRVWADVELTAKQKVRMKTKALA